MRHAVRTGRGSSLVTSSVLLRTLGVCLAIVVATSVAWAQAPVGTIAGSVRDQSDAVVPGAAITIRHQATGIERHAISGPDGTYSAPSLAAGTYVVVAELTGFRTQRVDVTVAAGRVATLDCGWSLARRAKR